MERVQHGALTAFHFQKCVLDTPMVKQWCNRTIRRKKERDSGDELGHLWYNESNEQVVYRQAVSSNDLLKYVVDEVFKAVVNTHDDDDTI